MAIFDIVQSTVDRLAPRGWKDLLALHGLDLGASNLAAELVRPLVDSSGRSTIDRSRPGFSDFCVAGTAAVAPGKPALSLLYHALASPDVSPNPTGLSTDEDFPTLAELDAIENYIYSLSGKKIADFSNAVVAVFAFQYRTGSSSVHRIHADMAYSRIGVARVGTAPMHYEPPRRSFWVSPFDGSTDLAVMPARYAAFIAERRPLSNQDSIMQPLTGAVDGDDGRTFLFPVHKLFAGTECLAGENIQISFVEYHRSEKLRKIHELDPAKGGVPVLPGFDIDRPPYLRESPDLVQLEVVGASTLVVPNATPTLAETVTQFNSQSGKDEVVRFTVPPFNVSLGGGRGNRFDTSSFQIPASDAGRAACEYASIRLHVRPNGQFFDVNTLNTADFLKVLETAQFQGVVAVEDGPLQAAHLVDGSCDGAIAVQVSLSQPLPAFAAVSLVAAPHFLPLVAQIDVERWAERNKLTGNIYFSQGAPTPLCYGRDVAPNPALLEPVARATAAFDRSDPANATFTAVLASAPQSQGNPLPLKATTFTTCLPDAAADVFAPGWDTSKFSDEQGDFYVNYGLGSPFPEDAKLCAALNSFWPAAAPDVGRTFGQMTALPLLDEELGLHPQHPKVLAGKAASRPGWDGEFGPFLAGAGKQVNFASIERSDYAVSALHGRLGIGLLGRIDAIEQLARMDAFRECADRIRGNTQMTNFRTLLVTAEKIADWSQRADRFRQDIAGPGYLFVFVDFTNPNEAPDDSKRVVASIKRTFTCQVTGQLVGIGSDNQPPEVTPRLHP